MEKVSQYYPCEVNPGHKCTHSGREQLCALDRSGKRTGCLFALEFAESLMHKAGNREKVEVFVDVDDEKTVVLQSGKNEVRVRAGRVRVEGWPKLHLDELLKTIK